MTLDQLGGLEEIRLDVAAFSDSDEEAIVSGDRIRFRRDGERHNARYETDGSGDVFVNIEGRRLTYRRFLGDELGRLNVLANAIVQKRLDVANYVDTQCLLTDNLEAESGPMSAFQVLRERCKDSPQDQTRLVFLTADAGQGKSALLRHLAYQSAQAYRDKGRWFLLHIDPAGSAFVRIEEAAAREIGRLRVSGLFFSGILRLIKRGLLAVAIDGFDEHLAEFGAAEAFNGLGAFIRELDGNGVVLAAARSAYFQASNYAAQSHLLSSAGRVGVEHVRLQAWQRRETLSYFRGSGVSEPERTYDQLAEGLDSNVVLLERPFLVSKLVEMLVRDPSAQPQIVEQLRQSVELVPTLIREFLAREVTEKWKDQEGTPYLSLDGHLHLLAAVAEEMWVQRSKELSIEILHLVAETVWDELRVPQANRRAINERVSAHAVLPASAARRPDHRAFDHDEFRNYFIALRLVEILQSIDLAKVPDLGSVDNVVKSGRADSLRRFLERDALPAIVATWTYTLGGFSSEQLQAIIRLIGRLLRLQIGSTYLRENVGLLCAKYATVSGQTGRIRFEHMYFDGDQWRGSKLAGAEFTSCSFVNIDLTGCNWTDCHFYKCDVNGITIDRLTSLSACAFDANSQVIGLIGPDPDENGVRNYVPAHCEKVLTTAGASFSDAFDAVTVEPRKGVPDEIRSILNTFFRIFARNAGATEKVLQMRLGRRFGPFQDTVLPDLLKYEVVSRSVYAGRGQQERYELNYPMETVLKAENPGAAVPKNLAEFWDKMRAE